MLDQLLGIERRLWANDAEYYEATYREDAVLIFPGVGRLTRSAAVDAIRDENRSGRHWAEVRFADIGLTALSPAAMLISYRAEGRWNDAAESDRVLCATVYVKEGELWRVAFHQQTPA